MRLNQLTGAQAIDEADLSIAVSLRRALGAQISSKQLRDDLMTMLIAGHETTAAVLTWTLHCLAGRPDIVARLQAEVCENIQCRAISRGP